MTGTVGSLVVRPVTSGVTLYGGETVMELTMADTDLTGAHC